jgi:glycine dehydrogenase subunit 1
MGYIPNTAQDQQEMLDNIGVQDFENLLAEIPKHIRFDGTLNLPAPMSELEVMQHLSELSRKNKNCEDSICFLGGGAYDHFVPAAVKHLTLRSEFYTAYTPYQPEVAQGTLQAIYEYQTMICELTGMDVSNASVYDGGSALGEASLLAAAHKRRTEILVSSTVNPNYIEVIKTYCQGRDLQVKLINWADGITSINSLKKNISDNTAAVIVQHPNYFGYLEDVFELSDCAHNNNALFVTSNDPISLTVLEPPSSYGTDIVTGEGQVLGNQLSFGGPYLGIFAATKKLLRKIPGRIVGQTVDDQGRRGFVLTLQTREQHIRRDKATSNICTNQGLIMMAAVIYMSLLGKSGLAKVAELSMQKSHYLANKIKEIDGFDLLFDRPFFKEFLVSSKVATAKVFDACLEKNIFAGIDLGQMDKRLFNSFSVAVTEKRSRLELDKYISVLRELYSKNKS